MKEKNKAREWLPITIVLSLVFWVSLAVVANGWRVDNIKKNKENCELRGYRQTWIEFNRTHIPETALPRIKEIEAIYLKG